MRRLGDFLETVVVVVILGALVHMVLEDVSVLGSWAAAPRAAVTWVGLGFDLFFTVEFFTRLYLALSRRRGAQYFLRERGWIDFLASIPLLLFNSLPNALALLAGAGLVSGLGSFLNVLKVIKAVRIARVLRLLRVTKLFRGIRYAHSPLVQRHIAMVTTISVTLIVACTLAGAALENAGVLPGLEQPFVQGQELRVQALAAGGAGTGLSQRAAAMAAVDPTILLVRPAGGATAWSRFDGTWYAREILPGDYAVMSSNGVEVFTDERPRAQALARQSLVFFAAVILVLLGYLFLYAPRLALGVTDPLWVMRRGMGEPGYSLQVKIPAGSEDDDVFALAALYNTVFLPLKDREGAGEAVGGSTALRIDDIRDLVE